VGWQGNEGIEIIESEVKQSELARALQAFSKAECHFGRVPPWAQR
jgi:hypothetical protein